MVLWRWWPMGGMLVVRLRRRMDSVRYQLVRRISAESGTRRESKTLSVPADSGPDERLARSKEGILGKIREEREAGTETGDAAPLL